MTLLKYYSIPTRPIDKAKVLRQLRRTLAGAPREFKLWHENHTWKSLEEKWTTSGSFHTIHKSLQHLQAMRNV